MRLYFEVDNEIDENCTNKCPWSDIGFYGETGNECYIGSVACQHCKFCYGIIENGFVGLPNKFGQKERIMYRRYVNCSFNKHTSWKYKLLCGLYKFKLWLKEIFKKER